jgi:signal-transduction protein with cAMP-binding, CBS, and nucleotidyltransferase domain
MYAKNIKRVPVVRDDKLVGIVARPDLIRVPPQRLGEKLPATPVASKTVNEALRRKREETSP